ncbi:MAG: response regulator [Candidatus Omnitrophica bacterium]|nr:response regulator [Candidatus Omnitrophota bacterium]
MQKQDKIKKTKILVVDDEKSIRDFLRLFLKKKGYTNVRTVENGQEALKAIQKEEFNLVLLDVKLPGMDGIELLRQIKKINKDTAVIMITGYPDEKKVKEAMQEGAYDYIIKPFDLFYLELVLLTKIIQLEALRRSKKCL